MRGRLVWIDLEMTGLNPETSVILEIAAVVTDGSLTTVSEGPDLAIHYPDKILQDIEPWSKRQHESSGLMERVRASSVDCSKAEKTVLAFLSKQFLIKYMPKLEAFFHYRNIDVSSIKELAKRWYPSLPMYKKNKAHLALSDIHESISELRYYREKVFRETEGLTARKPG